MSSLILASASPRRRDLLKFLGYEFTVVPAEGFDEGSISAPAEQLPELLALGKARWVAENVEFDLAAGDRQILGSDTLIAFEGEPIGKPADAQDARETLRRLSGKTHQVISGDAVLSSGRGDLVLHRSHGLADEVEHGANARTVAKVLVHGLPNLPRLGRPFERNSNQMSVVVGNEARQ